MEENEKYWVLGFTGFLGFLGFNGFRQADPWQFFLFCNFGLLIFFVYKYNYNAIIYLALVGVFIGLLLGSMGVLGLI
ncbi:MAG TPA: hypothetical protein VK444_03760 [Methanobacteriaceae archaeon]|nr:hypothetical protein [Methanobacteriaceae archaeon]